MRAPLRIALLGHIGGNIGHDMMALGVDVAVRHAFPAEIVETTFIEQHKPFSIYPAWNPLRAIDRLPYWAFPRLRHFINEPLTSAVAWKFRSRSICRQDMAVACGGPNIVANVSKAAQVALMMHHLHGAFSHHGIPVVNLSIGSCFPFERLPERITDAGDADFVRRMFKCSKVTTVRDRLAHHLCAEMRLESPLIPCPAMLAGDSLVSGNGSAPGRSGHVVVNFQKMGANEDWGQGVDPEQWIGIMRDVVRRLSRRHPVIFICHSEAELEWAEMLESSLPRYRPATLKQYGDLIAGAAGGICNRIHAAMALASIGVKPVAIGTDSRLGTVELLGLPHRYVKHVTADWLENEVERLISIRAESAESLRQLRQETLLRYTDILRSNLAR